MRTFEGSYLGDASRLSPTTRLECKICWHVYDPEQGCETWQVPPGTPFAALPDHWRCPRCDGERMQFMVLDDPGAGSMAAPSAPDPAEARLAAGAAALAAAFREVHQAQMRNLPMVNPVLQVESIGFRRHEGRGLGVLVTPWFMNLVLLPGAEEDWSGLVPGAKEEVEFPSGAYEFIHGNRPGLGGYKACSLFSPMFEFGSQLQAQETARAVLAALFDPALREAEDEPPAAAPPPPEPPKPPSRRGLLTGFAGA